MNFKVIKNLNDLPQFNPEFPTFADIETEELYVGVRLVQLYQPETSELIYVIDIDDVDLEEVKALIKPLWTVWTGASYDFGTLNMTTEKFDDIMYLARTAYPEWQEYALDEMIAKFKLHNLYEGLDKKKLQKAGFIRGAYLSHDQLRYSATDVYALSLIWKDKRIQQVRNITAYKVDILSMRYAVEYQQNGLLVDRAAVRKELDALEGTIRANELALNGLNPNSPKQCKAALGVESTDKPTLIRLISQGNNIAKTIYEQRRLLKRRTFLVSYNKPKVFTKFNVAGAVTGRFTSTGGDLHNGINAQQITRNLQYIFNQPTEDTVVIECDFGTAELRAATAIMREEVMYKELLAGMDLHKIAASMATGKPLEQITKEDRQKGKAVSFGLIFGMSADSFQEYAFTNYGVIFTLEEAKAIKKKYQEHYPAIARYHQMQWENYKDPSYYVTTALGRRAKPRLGTDAINIPTQGTIAETTKLAIHYMAKEDIRILKYIYNVVHDQINARVPKPELLYWKDLMVRNMKKAWTEICKTELMFYKDIPMPVDAEHSQAA